MATYLELFSLRTNSELVNKVTVACIVAAEFIRTEDTQTANHTERMIWAAKVFANPEAEARRVLWALLAANKAATASNILAATDAAIQTNVDAAIDVFALADAAAVAAGATP